ncbi:hypothetical protein AUEXF2481DRAFT_1748 [Aureobasidium subglaciale EXF-2481]|uniref:Phosphotransferase n=1 Tax=Aureobasidium subglaciale (strain EXF-2481) TaxID=1043005 RepID=A0A074YMK3_AURSE|nr:uncharacterized protein AUEXF2481DRAFT_1748 [Aureobasidium subglaciale EXF-2481]KEQ98920.1 hypothetical protein AUEXF2481DRAFT_1748 [Aureobasidium subglaciale EXF-2481]
MDSVDIVRGDSPMQAAEQETLTPLNDKLASEIARLEELFRIDQQKLKDITKRFEVELDEGLKGNNKNVPMNITWVLDQPHGDEKGSFLTVDLGGTNLRVCWITLPGARGKPSIVQEKYQLSKEVKTGTADQLWDEVADRMKPFIRDQKLDGTSTQPLPLGFTFSYPAMQDYTDHVILQTWTKGWYVKGVEGEDVTVQPRKAMDKRKLPVKLVALINDTTGAMIASAYHDPKTIIGAIFGEQAFEKMSAGPYVGEIFRLVLVDLARQSLIFKGQDISRVEESYILDTGFLSAIQDGSIS